MGLITVSWKKKELMPNHKQCLVQDSVHNKDLQYIKIITGVKHSQQLPTIPQVRGND